MAKRIIDLMPPRVKNPNNPANDDPGWVHYVEPFFGGGAVLLAQDPDGISEVVNDVNGELTNFWMVLQDPHTFCLFQRAVQCIPCSEPEFGRLSSWISEQNKKKLDEIPFEQHKRAAAFFVRNRQSRQALGKGFATLARNRTRRGMNELPSSWMNAIDGLPEVHARLQRVVIFNKSALDVIKQQDGPRTLFYLDPPYMHETRTAKDAYEFEMSDTDHMELLDTLAGIEGRFLLSGYASETYEMAEKANGWRRVDFEIDNKSSGKKSKEKKIESVWMNY